MAEIEYLILSQFVRFKGVRNFQDVFIKLTIEIVVSEVSIQLSELLPYANGNM